MWNCVKEGVPARETRDCSQELTVADAGKEGRKQPGGEAR